MDITNFFTQGSSKKRDLSDQLNNGKESKKPRKGSLEVLHVLSSSAMEDVFPNSLKA